MQEIITSIHIHSVYSDGLKTPPQIAQEAVAHGLDAIILTDHNVYPHGFDGYYSHNGQRVLLITGEEIHDKHRQPQKNHMLALGIQQDLSPAARDPQKLIDAIRADGGLSFIAHAYDPEMPVIDEADLSWVDWDIQGFTGLEIWNNLSELKIRVRHNWQAAFYALFPRFMALEPPAQIRAIWDRLLKDDQTTYALGGVDAHTFRFHFGPLTLEVFPYKYHFRSIHTHILLDEALSGDAAADSRAIIQALGRGHAFVGYDLPYPTRGFRFYATGEDGQILMGDRGKITAGQQLAVHLPAPAECRLIRNGEVLDARKVRTDYAWPVTQPGVYRLECYRRYLGRQRGWIFSNPIWID
ncbi:MAG: hypothetical protein PWQ55_1600 [Chloroflexota bacterium]|nr:hypothetical protein [Chloroflexota bacterium]